MHDTIPRTEPVSKGDDNHPDDVLLAAHDVVKAENPEADVQTELGATTTAAMLLQAHNGALHGDVFAPVEDVEDGEAFLVHVEKPLRDGVDTVEVGAEYDGEDVDVIHVVGSRHG